MAMAQYSYINNEKELEKYASYCQPTYRDLNEKPLLRKLLVMFRHGDRAPLSMRDSKWGDKQCVHCENKECESVRCGPGLLTKKGFEQGQALGQFIKNNYAQLLKGPVKAMHTEINRTQATLMGVLTGLDKTKTPISVNKAFVSAQECVNFRDSLAQSKDIGVDYIAFDNYMTSICNDVPLNCELLSCTPSVIEKIINDEVKGYESLMGNMRADFAVNAVGFAELAKALLDALHGEERLVLMAAHDSTVSKLLNGLNTDEIGIPPYASAVFIEIFTDKRGLEMVRVIYEGHVQLFGSGHEQYMDYVSFQEYLEAFAGKSDDIGQLCKTFNRNGGSNRKEILGLFEPQFISEFLDSSAPTNKNSSDGVFTAISSYLVSIGHGLLENSNGLFGRVSKLLKGKHAKDKSYLSKSQGGKDSKRSKKENKCSDSQEAKNKCGEQNAECEQKSSCENESCEQKSPCKNKPCEDENKPCEQKSPCENKPCEQKSPCENRPCDEKSTECNQKGPCDAKDPCESQNAACKKKRKKNNCKAKETPRPPKSAFRCAATAKYTIPDTGFCSQSSTCENDTSQPCDISAVLPSNPCTSGFQC